MNQYSQKYEFSDHETSLSYDEEREWWFITRNFLDAITGNHDKPYEAYKACKRFAICNDLEYREIIWRV